MNILLLLIPMALVIITIAVWFFFWAIKSEQFDDLDRQGANILFDDDQPQHPQQRKNADKQPDTDTQTQSDTAQSNKE